MYKVPYVNALVNLRLASLGFGQSVAFVIMRLNDYGSNIKLFLKFFGGLLNHTVL